VQIGAPSVAKFDLTVFPPCSPWWNLYLSDWASHAAIWLCVFNTYLSIAFIVLLQLNYVIAPKDWGKA
jgi:hypothetical protein